MGSGIGSDNDNSQASWARLSSTETARRVILSNLIPAAYDYIAITYVASGNGAGEIQTVIYKTGGAGGTTVATLTLTYDASNKLSTVTRS